MPKLLYISLMRLPTEKAHGLQIMQNCEAFAAAGCEVTLWVARRWNSRAMREVKDPYAYYGVSRNFRIRRVPCLDISPLFAENSAGARLAFYLLLLSYAAVCCLLLPFVRADTYYSRDKFLLALLTWLKARRALAYETHLFAPTRRGAALQRYVAARVGSVIAITAKLREDLIEQRQAAPRRTLFAHDGVRRARFADLPSRAAARAEIGWPADAFIVGYVGRLHTIGLDKGVGNLLAAVAAMPAAASAHLALVGGPDAMAETLRRQWQARGLPPENFLYASQVSPNAVPRYLRAFDVCAMPHPQNAQFAYYTSPLKLFEYMAAGGAIAASDLPAWADVISDGETALLLPPADVAAWTAALERLRRDPELRAALGRRASQRVFAHYTWAARAKAILAHIDSA